MSRAKGASLRLGEWLVREDALARVDLLRALETQVTRKIEALVNLDPATSFAFYRDVDRFGEEGAEELGVDALSTIFAAARSWKDRARIRKLVERASGLLLAIHPDSTLELVELTEEERGLLAELRAQPSHFVELVTQSTASADTLDTFLFVALVTRQLLVPGQAKAPMGVRSQPSRAPTPSPFPTTSTAPMPPTSLPPSGMPPSSVRAPGHKKISWSDLLAVRRPPSQTAMAAQRETAAPAPPVAPPSRAPAAKPFPPTMPAAKHEPAKLTASAAEAVAMIRRAEQSLLHKDVEGALRLAERAREQDASVSIVKAFHAWVRVLAGQLRPAEAIVLLDRVLAEDESSVPARLFRAKLLKRDDRVPEAMRELEAVLATEPDNRDAQNELKILLLTTKPGR